MLESPRRVRLTTILGVLLVGAVLSDLNACNPDGTKETCHTLEDWKTARGCVKFPDAAAGVCPAAADVEKGCSWQIVDARVSGNECCYTLPTSSL